MGLGIGLGSGASGGGEATTGELEVVSSTQASAALVNGVRYIPLSNGAVENIQGQFVAPSDGTYDIQVTYSMSAGNAGDVEVRLDYACIAATEAMSTALSSGTEFTFAPGNDTNTHLLSYETSANMGVAASANDLVTIKLVRTNDAADTHTADMRVAAIRWEKR